MKLGISHRRLYKLAEELYTPKELYHVTYSGNLPSIAQQGLKVAYNGGEYGIGGEAYKGHKAMGVFLTEANWLSYWFDLSEQFSENRSDNSYEDELTPVVLQVELSKLDPDLLIYDEIGTADSTEEAWIYQGDIPPDAIYYWDPGLDSDEDPGWYAIEDYEDYPLETSHAYDIEEDPEGDLYYFKSDSPFKPSF